MGLICDLFTGIGNVYVINLNIPQNCLFLCPYKRQISMICFIAYINLSFEMLDQKSLKNFIDINP